ncbi:OmpA family protein [Pseudooceanicola sp. C21-150M6]|uniref:OmpA family protein n=1 Tax=Pseudooceanicola sp. C21-150M6 TaxID=3434355 RepID=UPI003D7F3EBC
MRLPAFLILPATFVVAAALALTVATFAATAVERISADGVKITLEERDMAWADVTANGLQVVLTGTAPSEAKRFEAITAAGTIVDASRVIDKMRVRASEAMTPPLFSIELLRNDDDLSLIGLVPASTDRARLLERLDDLPGVDTVADLLETADYPVPDSWPLTLDFAISALRDLPQSKISLKAGTVGIKAIAESPEHKRQLETAIRRKVPGPITLTLDIAAPRPVIAPFTLRFTIDDDGARFDACSADTPRARDRILAAGTGAGAPAGTACTLGLGVPSTAWADAASAAIRSLGQLGQGSVTMSDADVSLLAAETTDPASFDRVVGELENDLPEVFTLHAVLLEPAEAKETGPAEFIATYSPEGQVQLRGRIRDELSRTAADSYAKAEFGVDAVYFAARLDDTLPEVWSIRVLAGLQALAQLNNGVVTVKPDRIAVSGNTGDKNSSAEIARLLSERLGDGQDFDIDVTYEEKLDPLLGIPTPEECLADVQAIQNDRKINFEPGSATVTADSVSILNDIADILKTCGQIRMEIAGFTDSQGRESMNLQLSQDRADTVLAQLRDRRVKTRDMLSRGYGEENPIADNQTEEGREANRRIEFSLIRMTEADQVQTTLESAEQSVAEEVTEEEGPAEETSADEQN